MKKLLILIVIGAIVYLFLSKKQPFIQPNILSQVMNSLPVQQQKVPLSKNTAYLTTPYTSTVQQKILGIQQQVSHLNGSDIASSPPQIQDIIRQIQSIPQGSINQIKQQCINICKRL